MYKCDDCNELFREVASWVEPHGERFYGSPCCSSGYEEVEECLGCGEYTEEKWCNKCKARLKKQFSELLHSNFDKEEIEELNELFDGEMLN